MQPEPARTPTPPALRYPSNPSDIGREITNALTTAVAGSTGLRVLAYPELNGASVRNNQYECYVLPRPDGRFQVDVWRPEGQDPDRIHHTDQLAEAVAIAVSACLALSGHQQREAGSPQPSGPASAASSGAMPS